MIKNNRLPYKKYISIKKQVFSHKIRLAPVFQLEQVFLVHWPGLLIDLFFTQDKIFINTWLENDRLRTNYVSR